MYYGSKLIGIAALTAAFDISGSFARATKAVIIGTGKSGGEYFRGASDRSGNTASGTAYFGYNGVEKSVMLSISCSPDGRLS